MHAALRKYNIPNYLYNGQRPVAAISMSTGQVVEVFESLVKAMEFVYGDSGTPSSRNSMKWKIGNAAKTGGVCKGYHWKYLDLDYLRKAYLNGLIA